MIKKKTLYLPRDGTFRENLVITELLTVESSYHLSAFVGHCGMPG